MINYFLICLSLLGLQGCIQKPYKSLECTDSMHQSPTMLSSHLQTHAPVAPLVSSQPIESSPSHQAKPSLAESPCLTETPGASLSSRTITIDPRIGQRFIVGFYGTHIGKAREQLEPYIRDYHIGGVILFGIHSVDNMTEDEKVRKDELFPGNINDNPQDLKALIEAIQNLNAQYSDLPLFIAIDQEGGLISRLRNCGLGPTLSHEELGQEDISKTTEEASKIARYLKTLGCNLNFAPVVDLAVNPENTVIVKNKRSFGEDPQTVTAHAAAYIAAHAKERIGCCLKHFPGHGSTTKDTHEDFTDASNTWDAIELIPYQELIKSNQVDLIMASHVYNANLDEAYPATLSKKTLTGLLKEKLGYKGLIISDDLEMKALLNHYSYETIIAKSAEAGTDIFIVGNHDARRQGVDKSIQELQRLYEAGEISEEALETSYQGILNLKKKL